MLKKISNYLMFIFMAVAITACGGDSKNDEEPPMPASPGDELIGRWVEVEDPEMPFILTFNSDQTGTISYTITDESRASLSFSQKFRWSVGTTADGITYCNILTLSGDQILEDGRYAYIVIGNNMSFGDRRFKR